MIDPVPREEIDYTTLYKTFLTKDTLLPLNCYDSRLGEAPKCRLPFPPEQSGFSWSSRLERAREELPRAVFRPTRPKIYKRTASGESGSNGTQNVTVLALEIPTKRGRGRPKKESTVLVDAAAVNRSSFYVKRTYKVNEAEDPGTSVGIHTLENYTLHGHGGADVNVEEIGIVRPERHYLRDNTKRNCCEYDLDDQDVEWLKLVKSSSFSPSDSSNSHFSVLNEIVMEKIIEELELGWNVLTQPLRKLQQRKEAAMYPDEVPCEICGDCDTSNCNVIVLCDDCDLAVHQECYGVPHIPEGPWLCRPCSEKKTSACNFKAKCMLCPWPGGALRKTTDHRWVHSLCAHLVPETTITFAPSDPYDLVDVCTLQSDRAKLKCVLCRSDPKISSSNNGYPIQCSSKMCHVAFHPMCARAAGWSVDYTNQRCFCCKHFPEESGGTTCASEEEPKLKLRLTLSSNSGGSLALSPTKSKYPNVFIGESCPLHVTRGAEKLRIPVFAPKILIDHICENGSNFSGSDIPEAFRRRIVTKIAKYWQLKRESRRGTPLLKSLQLDAGWSQTDSMSEVAFEKEWNDKMSLIKSLKILKRKVNLLRRRELTKLESLQSSIEIFDILSSPFSKILINFILKLQKEVDTPGYFAYPVPCDLFPDYPLIVKYPMDFSTMLKNLRSDLQEDSINGQLFYPDLKHFYADLKLIWENSRLYNTRTSVFYQAADRLEVYSKALLKEILEKFRIFGIEGPFEILRTDGDVLEKETSVLFNFENEEGLPEPTPARFPKSNITSILSNSEDSVNSMKRRGRPPKRRDGVINSFGSNEEGEGVALIKVKKTGEDKVPKKRGRPPKKVSKIVEDEPVEPEQERYQEQGSANDQQDDDFVFDDYLDSPSPKKIKKEKEKDEINLVWVPLKTGNWCPGEIIKSDTDERRPRRNFTDDVNVKLFDPVGTCMQVPRNSLKPLTKDFEKDIAGLEIEGIVSRKYLAAAHRTALEQLK